MQAANQSVDKNKEIAADILVEALFREVVFQRKPSHSS